jgi:hypothetical protein
MKITSQFCSTNYSTMKNLLLIVSVFCYGFAGAQTFSKQDIDPKTGDTIQMTKTKRLIDTYLKSFVTGEPDVQIYWRFEKVLPKNHRPAQLRLWLHGSDAIFATNNPLLVGFSDGRSLSLAIQRNENGFTAVYVLEPEAIHELLSRQMNAVNINETSSIFKVPVKAKRAADLKACLRNVTGSR